MRTPDVRGPCPAASVLLLLRMQVEAHLSGGGGGRNGSQIGRVAAQLQPGKTRPVNSVPSGVGGAGGAVAAAISRNGNGRSEVLLVLSVLETGPK